MKIPWKASGFICDTDSVSESEDLLSKKKIAFGRHQCQAVSMQHSRMHQLKDASERHMPSYECHPNLLLYYIALSECTTV